MKLEKVIAVRTDKTVYRDGDKAIKVFSSNYSKANVLNEALTRPGWKKPGLTFRSFLKLQKLMANGQL